VLGKKKSNTMLILALAIIAIAIMYRANLLGASVPIGNAQILSISSTRSDSTTSLGNSWMLQISQGGTGPFWELPNQKVITSNDTSKWSIFMDVKYIKHELRYSIASGSENDALYSLGNMEVTNPGTCWPTQLSSYYNGPFYGVGTWTNIQYYCTYKEPNIGVKATVPAQQPELIYATEISISNGTSTISGNISNNDINGGVLDLKDKNGVVYGKVYFTGLVWTGERYPVGGWTTYFDTSTKTWKLIDTNKYDTWNRYTEQNGGFSNCAGPIESVQGDWASLKTKIDGCKDTANNYLNAVKSSTTTVIPNVILPTGSKVSFIGNDYASAGYVVINETGTTYFTTFQVFISKAWLPPTASGEFPVVPIDQCGDPSIVSATWNGVFQAGDQGVITTTIKNSKANPAIFAVSVNCSGGFSGRKTYSYPFSSNEQSDVSITVQSGCSQNITTGICTVNVKDTCTGGKLVTKNVPVECKEITTCQDGDEKCSDDAGYIEVCDAGTWKLKSYCSGTDVHCVYNITSTGVLKPYCKSESTEGGIKNRCDDMTTVPLIGPLLASFCNQMGFIIFLLILGVVVLIIFKVMFKGGSNGGGNKSTQNFYIGR
jgi:hypothetical protein